MMRSLVRGIRSLHTGFAKFKNNRIGILAISGKNTQDNEYNLFNKRYTEKNCLAVKVLDIYDQFDSNIKFKDAVCLDDKYIFKVGETVESKGYGYDGIHYFLSEDAAYQYCYKPDTGRIKEYDSNGFLKADYYQIDNKMYGTYKSFRKGQKKEECTYINNIRNGERKIYVDGLLKEKSFYINDKLNGYYEKYHNKSDQLSMTGYYSKGRRDGNFVWYYESGRIKKKCHYRHGLLLGKCESWYDNGELKLSYENYGGNFNGKFISYYNNGQINVICNYKFGKLNGKYKHYLRNGNLKLDCNYINDEFDGKYIFYNDNRDLIIQIMYKSGKMDGEYIEYENGKKTGLWNIENDNIITS